MADKKITELDASAGLALADLFVVVDDPAGTPATQKATGTQVVALVQANTVADDVGALAQPGGTTTDGGIVTGSGTSGDAVAISSTTLTSVLADVSDNASAIGSHIGNTSNPHSVTAAQVGAVTGPVSSTTGNVPSFADTSGDVLADSGKVAADIVTGPASVPGAGAIAVYADTGGKAITHVSGITIPNLLYGAVSTQSTASRTVGAGDVGLHLIVDSATIAGDCTITVPDSLTVGFRMSFRLSGAGGDIIFTPSGTMTLKGYGVAPVSGDITITGEDSIAHLFIESATVAIITYVSAGA